jgi:hypothetical protein
LVRASQQIGAGPKENSLNSHAALEAPLYGEAVQSNEPFITPPEHLNFFSARSLTELLAGHGFLVEATHWVSRIPKRAFEKRLANVGDPILPILNKLASIGVAGADALRLGMIIQVYARKVR